MSNAPPFAVRLKVVRCGLDLCVAIQ